MPKKYSASGRTGDLGGYASRNGSTVYCFNDASIEYVSQSKFNPNMNQIHKVSRGSFTPSPGDLVMFNWSELGSWNHVGLVYKVSGNTLY